MVRIVALVAFAVAAGPVSAQAPRRTCSGIAAICQEQCTRQVPQGETVGSCQRECGGYRDGCLRTGTWRGRLSTIADVARE